MYRASLTRISSNAKTGPIPVSTTEASTCPPTCGEFDTCYAKFGHLSIHWNKVSTGQRGMLWPEFCDEVSRLPRKQFWRHNQAGDLPGDGVLIDQPALNELVKANGGRRGFTYTHYPLSRANLLAVRKANAKGFTINISCDSVQVVDKVRTKYPELPLAVVLPSTERRHALTTPEGRKVVVCPATYREEVNCANCQICYESSETRAVIGFPAHGTKKRVIDLKLIKEV